MSAAEEKSNAWFDSVLLGLIVMTLVLSAGRIVLAAVRREPFTNELSLAMAFALLSFGALTAELTYRHHRPRPSS